MVDAATDAQPLTAVPDTAPQRVRYFPSPEKEWRAEFIYFLLIDRFHDGAADRPSLNRQLYIGPDHQAPPRPVPPDGPLDSAYWNMWAVSGRNRFQGGTIRGVRDKLPYLHE